MGKTKYNFVKDSLMRRLKNSIGVVENVILDFYNHRKGEKSDDLYLRMHPLMVKLDDLKRLQQEVIEEVEAIQKELFEN